MVIKNTKDVLSEARKKLLKNKIDTKEARLLLARAMNVDVGELVTIDYCSDYDYKVFLGYIERRIEGEPFAYIVGYKEFMKLNFEVNKNVLIPRDDTEVVVLEAIKQCKENILDMCTGSGCIAVSLAKYLEKSVIDASDICANALAVAKRNAKRNKVKVNFIKSDLFENITKKYDMIVSNPPYIKTSDIENLQKEVRMEPIKALNGGENGLYFYDEILKNAKKHLTQKGIILLEIGYDQARDVSLLAKKYNYKKIRKIKDLSNNDRVIYAERG